MKKDKADNAYKYFKERIINGVLASVELIDVKPITITLNIIRTPVDKALRKQKMSNQ